MHSTQQTLETNIHAFSAIRTRDPNNLAAADLNKFTARPPISGYPNSKYLRISRKLNVIIASHSVLFTTYDSSEIRVFMIP
jgi:hypothetical protein